MTTRDYFPNAVAAIRYLTDLGFEHVNGGSWTKNDRSAVVVEGSTVDEPCVVFFHYDN